MNQALSGLETNMIVLLIMLLIFGIVKFVSWTIAVHRTNLKIQKKLGQEAFDWIVFDNKKVEDEHMTEENVKEVLKLLDVLQSQFVTNLMDSVESLRRKQMGDRVVKTFNNIALSLSGMSGAIAKSTESFKKFGEIIQSIGLKNEI